MPGKAPANYRYSFSAGSRGGTIGGGARLRSARNLLSFSTSFGACARTSFSTRAKNARRSAAVGAGLRGGRGGLVGSGRRVSILAKRRSRLYHRQSLVGPLCDGGAMSGSRS
jgi:hypothetical protein